MINVFQKQQLLFKNLLSIIDIFMMKQLHEINLSFFVLAQENEIKIVFTFKYILILSKIK